MADGDKAPTSPSYCHPWASGVTHWLSEAMLGVTPLKPGFDSFVVLPHVSGNTLSTVAGTQPTPHGPISVTAERDNVRGTVEIEVNSPTAGFAGLRLVDEATGCELDTASVIIQTGAGSSSDGYSETVGTNATGTQKTAVLLDASGVPRLELSRIHPSMQVAHVYVALPAGRHTIVASFRSDCFSSVGADSFLPSASTTGGPGGTLPTIPPFPVPRYPGSWTVDTSASGSWRGKYGKAGYSLFAFDQGKDVTQLPSWVYGECSTNSG